LRLGDVRDPDRLADAMEGHEVVIHAAALKIIREGLANPDEMTKTNVLGTMNVLRTAGRVGALRVLLISSDKACNAVNFYGQTKALAEGLTVAWNIFGYPRGTWYAAVRYGNVLGSRGSVIYTWRRQVREGRALTVVPGMTRFCMMLSETVALILRALARMRAGEIFVPHLPAFRIEDLARAVALAEVDATAWPIEAIPALPTEKLHEELVSADEAARAIEAGEETVIEPALLAWPRPAWEGEKAQPRRSDEVALLSVDMLRQRLGEVP
ncbi:MAG: polysaccharide biosynthesis protein, partial [Dehalococcoidia bacterium]|nr:polysaccharide biosynthesis protein [Dehalococcoidia bacterium]